MDNVLVLSDDGKTIEGVKDKTVVAITIPEGINTIGFFAFSGCCNLVSVTIPNSVNILDECAFYDCSSLTSVTLPNSVTNL